MARTSKSKTDNNITKQKENNKKKGRPAGSKNKEKLKVSEKEFQSIKEPIMQQLNEITHNENLSEQMFELYNMPKAIMEHIGEVSDAIRFYGNNYYVVSILKKWKRNHPEFEIDEKLLIIGDADALHHVKR